MKKNKEKDVLLYNHVPNRYKITNYNFFKAQTVKKNLQILFHFKLQVLCRFSFILPLHQATFPEKHQKNTNEEYLLQPLLLNRQCQIKRLDSAVFDKKHPPIAQNQIQPLLGNHIL